MFSEQKQSMEAYVPEVRMLANFDLDVEELEQRLELATLLHIDCYSDSCGTYCNNNCGSYCNVNSGCTSDGCSSHCC